MNNDCGKNEQAKILAGLNVLWIMYTLTLYCHTNGSYFCTRYPVGFQEVFGALRGFKSVYAGWVLSKPLKCAPPMGSFTAEEEEKEKVRRVLVDLDFFKP